MTSNAGWRDYWKADRPASCMPENERTAQEIAATWQKWFAECAGRQPHPGYCNRQWHRPDPCRRGGPAIESRVRAYRRRSRGHRSPAISEQPRRRHARRDVHRLSRSRAPAVRGWQLRRGGLAIWTGVCRSRRRRWPRSHACSRPAEFCIGWRTAKAAKSSSRIASRRSKWSICSHRAGPSTT